MGLLFGSLKLKYLKALPISLSFKFYIFPRNYSPKKRNITSTCVECINK